MLSSSIAQLQETISQQGTRLDTALTTHQETFNKAESMRLLEHQETVQSARRELDAVIQEAEEDSRAGLANQEALGKEVLSRLDQLEEQARAVVGAVANASTSTDYGKHAENQRKIADKWRWIAVVLSILAFSVTVYSVYIDDTEEEPWTVSVIKAVTSVTILAAAGYAAKESSQHRREEIGARNTQLKLVALDPFIANLEKENREQMKIAAAKHLFIIEGRSQDQVLVDKIGDGIAPTLKPPE